MSIHDLYKGSIKKSYHGFKMISFRNLTKYYRGEILSEFTLFCKTHIILMKKYVPLYREIHNQRFISLE